MKKTYLFLFIGLCTFLLGCTFDDMGSFIDLEIQDAVVFENNQNYSVGDTLYIDLNFSRYLDEEGFSNKLDVFESSGEESFKYRFSRLARISELDESLVFIEIAPEFRFAEKGSIDDSGNVSVELNMETAQYESRIGVILQEAGRFDFPDLDFIFLGEGSLVRDVVVLRGPRIRKIEETDRVSIVIDHTFSDSPPDFTFTVTE